MFLLLQTYKFYLQWNLIKYCVSLKRWIHITVMNNDRIPVAFAYTKFIPGSSNSPEQLPFMNWPNSPECPHPVSPAISKTKDRERGGKSRGFSLLQIRNGYVPFLLTFHWPRLVIWHCLTARVSPERKQNKRMGY